MVWVLALADGVLVLCLPGIDMGIGLLSGQPDMMPWDLVFYTCMLSEGVGGCSGAHEKGLFSLP